MCYILKYFILQILGENFFFLEDFGREFGYICLHISFLPLHKQIICSYSLLAFFITKSTSIDKSLYFTI